MSNINPSRRRFLKQGGAMSAAGTLGTSWLFNLAAATDAMADDWSGYKALVCIFLEGGNDACNTVLPEFNDTTSWARYTAVRGGLALAKPTSATSGPYVKVPPPPNSGGTDKYYPLHPSLINISAMLNTSSSKMAIVANVGNISVANTIRDTATLPPRLRSHNDQTTVWHHGRNNMATDGWGGRAVAPTSISSSSTVANNFRSIVLGNNNAFGVAAGGVRAYGMVRKEGVISLLPEQDLSNRIFGTLPVNTVEKVIKGDFSTKRTNLIEQDYADVVQRALASGDYMKGLLATQGTLGDATLPGLSPTQPYPLAQDLQMVAKVIKGHIAANVSGRQVFYVSLGSFDIHTDGAVHAKLLKQLDESLNYFKSLLSTTDLDKVVAFTASEFGRLLHANGDGCDHGWGGHQFVMGGPVAGGTMYGSIPDYAHNGTTYASDYMTNDGAMVPTISVGAFAAELCKWFGVQGATNINNVIGGATLAGESSINSLLPGG